MKTDSSQGPGKISLILLCWNDQSTTIQAIIGLQPLLTDGIDLWVVDNGSYPPFTLEGLTSSNVHVIRSEANLGFAGGTNLGLREALLLDPQYILLVNTDAQLTEHCFDRLLQYARLRPGLAIAGPALKEGNKVYFGGQDPALHLNTRLTSSGEVSYISGTVFLCQPEVFTSIGLLDERFFFSGEIADFCHRARTAGFEMGIDESLIVEHQVELQSTERRDTLYLYYNLRNRFLYISKHYPARKWSLYLLWIFRDSRMMVGALLEGRLSKVRAIFWSLYDGLFGNFGNRNDRFE